MNTNPWNFRALTPYEIYVQLLGGPGSGPLSLAQQSISRAAQREAERAERIRRLADRIRGGWQGSAGDAAYGAARPLATNAIAGSERLDIAQDLMARQAESFHRAANSVRPVAEKPPESNILNDMKPFETDLDREIKQYQADARHNIDVFAGYDSDSLYNETNMPDRYSLVDHPGDLITVTPSEYRSATPDGTRTDSTRADDTTGTRAVVGSGGTGTGTGGGTGGGATPTAAQDGVVPPVSTDRPSVQVTMPAGQLPPVGVPDLVGPAGRSTGTGLDGAVAAGAVPFGPGSGGGPTARSGGGGSGIPRSGGGPGGGTGGGPSAGRPGGGPGAAGPGSGAGAPRAGGEPGFARPGGEPGIARPGGIGAAAAEQAARSGAGRGPGGAGMPAGGRGQGEEDTEHERTFMFGPDPDETFGSDVATAPPVIGDEVYEDRAR